MNAKEIASALNEVVSLLQLKGENPFKVRAYENASRLVQSLETPLSEFVEQANEGKVKGVGPALREAITELYETGDFHYLEELRAEFPDELLELLEIQGLGAKKVKVLYEELEIESIEELEKACKEGSVATLKGFGKKTQDNILAGIERLKTYGSRFLLPDALEEAVPLLEALRASKFVKSAELAGSLRRSKETVKDIDIVATSTKPSKLMDAFTTYAGVTEVVSIGETKSSVVLTSGIAADLRVVAEREFGSALLHFTGSKEHNTRLRAIALKLGLKLNEYGLFKGERALKLTSEKAIFNKLGLCFVPPELKEDLGEVEAAEKLFKKEREFPALVEPEDLTGILHAHSTYSDGADTLEDMARAVKKLGYKYLGITDHSQTAAYAGGLKPDDIKRQHAEIDALNDKLKPFKILKGIESDILAKGGLDFKDSVLESFDFIIASIHSNFTMSEREMTARIVRAVKNPYTRILGHPTGRLLLKRDGYAVNVFEILEAAAEHNVAIEINANPHRLDLDWRYLKRAKEFGIPIPICPDAHSVHGIENVKYGVGIARKGGLTKNEVLNCWSLNKLQKFFRRES